MNENDETQKNNVAALIILPYFFPRAIWRWRLSAILWTRKNRHLYHKCADVGDSLCSGNGNCPQSERNGKAHYDNSADIRRQHLGFRQYVHRSMVSVCSLYKCSIRFSDTAGRVYRRAVANGFYKSKRGKKMNLSGIAGVASITVSWT
ncbi:MAG: hypothetical protein ACLRWH_03715 [Emergencia sp.]